MQHPGADGTESDTDDEHNENNNTDTTIPTQQVNDSTSECINNVCRVNTTHAVRHGITQQRTRLEGFVSRTGPALVLPRSSGPTRKEALVHGQILVGGQGCEGCHWIDSQCASGSGTAVLRTSRSSPEPSESTRRRHLPIGRDVAARYPHGLRWIHPICITLGVLVERHIWIATSVRR